jgi:hypothetical protein
VNRPNETADSFNKTCLYLRLILKTYQFKVNVKDDSYDAVKPQISKIQAVKILPSGLACVMAALVMSVC